MTCKLCRNEKHLWKDNPTQPTCYFDNTSANWNCATLSRIKSLMYLEDTNVHYRHQNDQSELLVSITGVIKDCLSLYMTWYKNRGRIEQVWLLSDKSEPRNPTEKELRKIIKFYGE